MTSTANPAAIVAIRLAASDDAPALRRLAVLDSAPVPAGRVLLGLVDGRPLAALSLDDGTVVADPFCQTADLVALLRGRADRLTAAAPRARRARGAVGRLRRGSPSPA